MSRLLISAALLLCATAAPAAIAETASSGGSSNDMVCHYEQETGSHIKKRSCATRAEREDQAKRDQKEMQRLTREIPRGPGKD